MEQVWEGSMHTKSLLPLFLISVMVLPSMLWGQNTYVPDNNFEQALIDLGYDDTLDDFVLTANINGVTSLDVNAKEISDLTGIEGFTALTILQCSENALTALDVSNNTALIDLRCSYNQITSLDVSANTALTLMWCHENQLTSLDVSNNTALINLRFNGNQLTALDVSNNTALDYLYCNDNQLTSLDVSANTALGYLHCYDNQLTSLDVSANTALTVLMCSDNQLTSLDVSANTALEYLFCYDNQLTSLDVSANTALTILRCNGNQLTYLDVSNNTALTRLECHNNQLTTLDVSANTALTNLRCFNNELTYLNMKNGITDQLTTFDATDNSLTCIEVNADDVAYATANWTSADGQIDAGVTFSESCAVQGNPDYTYVPDNNFEQALIDLGIDDTLDDFVLTASISGVTYLNVSSKSISDLTGIEDFTALNELYCYGNSLTSIDVSSNTALTKLYCGNNQLTSIDVSNNTTLNYLILTGNQLTSLDVSANTALTDLSCDENQITSLDVSTNTSLTQLRCNNNQLTSLDVSNNTALTNLRCYYNQLTSLDVSNNTALTNLHTDGNQLTSLDVSANTALTALDCSSNQLTSLDVSSNTALTFLSCQSNQLTYLNMKNGVTDQLTWFFATNNSLTCIEVQDPDWATANWTSAGGHIDSGVSFAVCCSSTDVSNWHVATHGSDTHGCGYQGSPFATIQAAINAATSGDTVTVAAGTYTENINFNSKSLMLIGASAASTIIDGNNSGRVVVADNSQSNGSVLKNFTIQNGNANGTGYEGQGGGVNIFGVTMTMENLIIRNNTSLSKGGGLFLGSGADVTLSNSKIIGNSANSSGGGVHLFAWSELSMSNVEITGNTTTHDGAGIYANWDDNILSLVNSTVGGNTSSADNKYALYWEGDDNTLTIVNTIIWNPGLSSIYMDTDDGWDDQVINVAGSVIQGGIAGGISTDDASSVDQNISGMVTGQDPAFVNTSGGDYSIANSSGAISVGVDQVTFSSTTFTAPATDLAGNTRPNPANTLLDAGAYENINGIAGYTGDTWYVNASAGLAYGNGSATYPLREIQPAVELAASGNTVYVAPGTYTENVLLEGKDLSILSTGNRDNTIIDANGSGSPVTFYGNSVTSATVLNGFTLQNGGGSGGYGIYCYISSPILVDLNIKDNTNTAPPGDEGSGGGIRVYNNAHPTLVSAQITGNTGRYGGGIGLHYNSSLAMTNVTIAGNTAISYGGGLYCDWNVEVSIMNSIFWDNIDPQAGIYIGTSGSTAPQLAISYSDIEGGLDDILNGSYATWGSGNKDSDPMFTDASAGDYTPASGSPVIDVGNPNNIYRDSDGTHNNMGFTGGTLRSLEPSEHDFRYASVGSSLTKDIVLFNGGADITISGAAFGGSNYSVSGSFPLTVASNTSTTLTVTFTPASQGTLTDNLTLSSDQFAGNGTVTIPLSGIGVSVDGTIQVPSVIADIQDAIDFASSGDSIIVSAGTYTGTINLNGKDVILVAPEGPSSTILDGNGVGPVVTIANDETAAAILDGFTITGGSASNGGGLYIFSESSPTLKNLVITGNTASSNGGGAYIYQYCTPTLTNTKIINNSANYGGGVCQSWYSDVTFENVEISGNTATYKGAAIYHYLQGSLTIINSTIAGNSGGVGAYYASSDDTELIAFNSIFWNSGLTEIYLSGASYRDEIARVGQCLIEGGTSGIYEGDGDVYTYGSITTGDPAFVDTSGGDYHLSAQSAAISAGVDQLDINGVTYTAPATDMDGVARPNPVGTTLDLGAYEHENGVGPYDGPIWYVNGAEALPYGNGSISAPFSMIGPAIGAAESGDTVQVAAGTYVENIDFNGKNIAVIGEDRETTIIDGNQAGSVVLFTNYETSAAVLKNFTIQNGSGSPFGSETTYGGGIYITVSNPVLENLIIQNNSASWGGGLEVQNSASVLKNLTIRNNHSSYAGGGLSVSVAQDGMAIYNTVIYGNTTTSFGGGVHIYNMQDATPQFSNVTINNNTSNYEGGGIYSYYYGNSSFLNSIIRDNSPQEIYFPGTSEANSMSVSYSNIEGGQDSIVTNDNATITWGNGNIDVDPLFVDADNGDYHLSDLSPAISAAASEVTIDGVTYTAPTTDIEGNPRPNPAGTVPDMGAYENENGAGPYNGPVWYVDASSELPYANGSESAKFSKIQYGINAAAAGDTVLVSAGTYVENINFNGKNISVIGSDRETTIIDGDSSGTVVTLANGETSSAVLDGFTIQNGSSSFGSGIDCHSFTSPTLQNLVITGNSASYGGGISIKHSSNPTLQNILIAGNSAYIRGAGVYCFDNSSPKIENVTIIGNYGSDYGGGISVNSNSHPFIMSSIVWNNSPDEIHFFESELPNAITVSYSDIQGGQDSIITNDNGTVTWGVGNIDVDPVFVDTANGNYHLLATSQLINAGHPDSTDSDGSRADMGAYPYLNNYSGPTWYITESGNDTTGTGASDDPFRSIQSGINFSSDDDSVTVAAGTYVENINFRGRNIKVVGEDRETTIIDGDSTEAVVIFINNEDSSATLKNFTIQNGYTLPPFSTSSGGGIRVMSSSPTLINLIVKNNRANDMGGGLFLASSNSVLQNLEISSNIANKGGGISVGNSDPVLTNVTIVDNAANNTGGGMRLSDSYATMTNVTISGNTATVDGGGVYLNNSSPVMSHVTMSGNSCDNHGGGIFMKNNSNPSFSNSVLWNDLPQEIYMEGSGGGEPNNATIGHTNIQGGQDSITTNDNGTVIWGSGNIDVDPMFVDTANGNYHLLASSQLINAGHPDSTDSDGSRADIGAYPYLNSYSGPTWYIAESGNDTTATGASDNPFRSIQSGINFSSDADSVTVAAGTYVENINFRGRNIKMVGAGRETTTIDGDSTGIAVMINNTSSSSLLKGFTIQNGSGSSGFNNGAGVYCDDCVTVLKNLIVTENNQDQQGDGSGIYSNIGNISIENVSVTNNTGDFGAVGLLNGSTATLNGVTISDNVNSQWGGGIYVNGSVVNIYESQITNNSAGHGGGLYSTSSSVVHMQDVSVTSNTANDGGGMYLYDSGHILANVTISGNTANYNGGGMILNGSNPTITNVTISGNTANDGGGMYLYDSDPTLTNLTISGNTSNYNGAGMYLYRSDPILTNVTISGNTAPNVGGGIFISNNSNPILLNTIIAGNESNEIEFDASQNSNTITITYSDIQGGQDSIVTNDNGTVTWGSGNIDVDPMFVDTADGNYHLLASSMLINAGHPDSTDSDGSRADMGAYPYLNSYSGPTWYITESGNDTTATGASDDPFRSIQAGINFSSESDSVTVAAGTYVENINFRGRNIKVVGEDRETTIIDGDSSGTVVTFINGEDSAAVLSGFTIQNGYTSLSENIENGGGVYLSNASPILKNLIVKNCTAHHGGGIFVSFSSSKLDNIKVFNNASQSHGGGVYLQSSNSVLTNIECYSNSTIAGGNGAGMQIFNRRSGQSPTIIGSIFHNNEADYGAGGVAINTTDPQFFQSTIFNNRGGSEESQNAGGIHIGYGSSPVINSCIINGNSSGQILFDSEGDPSSISIQYSLVELDSIVTNDNGTVIWGSGNIDVDPMFVDTANGNYHLLADSRLIDAGHPDSTDADGTVSDMGAYYYDQAGQPVRVQKITTTPSTNNIALKWPANTESDLAGYNIYRSIDPNVDYYNMSQYTTTADSFYVDDAAVDNTTYYYRVSAVDGGGDEGILAFADHGRMGNDTTAVSMGADDRWINVPESRSPVFSPEQDYTLEFYFHPLGYENAVAKIMRLSGLSIYLATAMEDSFRIRLMVEDGSVFDGDMSVRDSNWHHLAVTAPAGENIKLWLDGHLSGEAGPNISFTGSSGVDINSSDPANSYAGILDEVRLSNSLRYTSAFVPPGDEFQVDETTLALWRLNEGSFDEVMPAVYDWSGNGYHGIVSSATNPDWVSGSPTQPEGQPAFVINEIMPNPSGSDGGKEWIEVYNNFYTPLNLEDWIISGGSDDVTLGNGSYVQPNEYLVLVQNSDSTSNGGIAEGLEYGTGISLSNSGESITLTTGSGQIVDSLTYHTGFPYGSGVSMELVVPQWDNADSASWVASGLPYGDGDNLGSPGSRNDAFSGSIVVSLDTIDFSHVTEGEEVSETFWIANNGVAELHVSSITTGTENFSVDPEDATLTISDSVEITIIFTPPVVDEYADTISILSNDPFTPLSLVTVSGAGVNESADIVVTDGITDSLSVLNFPFTRVDESSNDTIYIVNIGTPDLDVEEIFIEGDASFSTPGESGLISFMDTLEIPVTFSPTATGSYTANLVLGSNDPDEATYTVALNGVAAEHIIISVPDYYATIMEAITAAYPEDTVQVGAGTYEENLNFADKNLVLRSTSGPDSTIVEGDGTTSVLNIFGGQSTLTKVQGFTFTGGGGDNGGGIRIDSSSTPVFQDIIIVDNDAEDGAGIYIESSAPTFLNTFIQYNDATGNGGGIAIRDNANPVFNYCLITGNDAEDGAGIFVRESSNPVFNHITLADNEASGDGGALYIRDGSHPQITNSIIWNNGDEAISFSSSGSASEFTVNYSIVDGGEAGIALNGNTVNWGAGNLDQAPLFNNQYSLQWYSPAIDAGDPSGSPDPDGTLPDMGRFYYDQTYQPPNPPVGLSYFPGSGEVDISWTANTEADLTHYIIYKGQEMDALDSIAEIQAPTTNYVDTNLDPTIINYYALTAVDSAGLDSDTSEMLAVSFPTITTSDDNLDFSDVRVESVKTLSMTLANTGSDTLFVDSIYVADTTSGFSVALGGATTSRSLVNRLRLKAGKKARKAKRNIPHQQQAQSRERLRSEGTGSTISAEDPGRTKTRSSSMRSISPKKKQVKSNSFTKVLEISTEILPGETIGLDVSFTRADTATVTDNLRITSDDPIGNEDITISLSARSVAPALTFSTTELDFGNITDVTQQSFQVTNEGTDTLTVASVLPPTGFSVSWEDSVLLPSESAQLDVIIAPEDNGCWTGDIEFSSDNYLQSQQTVSVMALSISPLVNHDFGGVLTTLTADTSFIINNVGNTDLVIDSISIDQTMFTTDLAPATIVTAGGSQTITTTFAPTLRDSISGNVLFHTAVNESPIEFGLLSGDGWEWPESEFAAKSLSVVTYVDNNTEFDIELANLGDYPLSYTMAVDADFGGWIWLSAATSGEISGTTIANIPVSVLNTENLDPGTYEGAIYFGTNTGSDPDQVVANTDTVNIFMTLLGDDSQITDTTITVPAGNTDPIVVTDSDGNPLGVTLDFVNSSGGTVTVQSVDALPPVDESTPWMDPDGNITDPVFPEKYYEITTEIEGDFLTDIGFDYLSLAGVSDPSTLRLAKRPSNSGTGEAWTVITMADTELDETNGNVVAKNQTSFSQWAMVSNESDNSFTDTQGPVMASVSLTPSTPTILEDVVVTAVIDDDTGIETATLYYMAGGGSAYSAVSMTDNGSNFTGTIPGNEVTLTGLFYYIVAVDLSDSSYSTTSDTLGVEVQFIAGSLTTNSATGSAYSTGLPMDKWRLISIPAVLDETAVGQVIGDELGTQVDTTWRIFEYDLISSSFKANPVDFATGEGYWIYQRVEDNLLVGTTPGQTGNMSGTNLTLKSGWSIIGSPYPFPISLSLDQVQFYGPITYGLSGEDWSNVVTELDPWNGYAVYNRTASDQTITLDPLFNGGARLARTSEEAGWQLMLSARAGDYQDTYNYVGCLETAENGLDWHDNPEMISPGNHLSLSFKIPGDDRPPMTSDFRELGLGVQIWSGELNSSGVQESVELSWSVETALPSDYAIMLVDLTAGKKINMISDQSYDLGHINERYAHQFKLVAGTPDQVTLAVDEILAAIPEELSLDGNYPNPFNPTTTIRFGLPEPQKVRITVINLLGQEITELVNGWYDIGRHEVVWRGRDHLGRPVASGMYFTVLSDGNKTVVQKMLLLK